MLGIRCTGKTQPCLNLIPKLFDSKYRSPALYSDAIYENGQIYGLTNP